MRAAYTLLEVLAVVVLLSVTTAAGLVCLSSTAVEARVREGISVVAESDQWARLHAKMRGPVYLRIDAGAVVLESEGEWRSLRDLPSGVTVSLLDDGGQRLSRVRVDARGWSVDYVASIRAGETHWTGYVSGLTGWIAPASGGGP